MLQIFGNDEWLDSFSSLMLGCYFIIIFHCCALKLKYRTWRGFQLRIKNPQSFQGWLDDEGTNGHSSSFKFFRAEIARCQNARRRGSMFSVLGGYHSRVYLTANGLIKVCLTLLIQVLS
jgi:hypothetical protein